MEKQKGEFISHIRQLKKSDECQLSSCTDDDSNLLTKGETFSPDLAWFDLMLLLSDPSEMMV
jgi:hypothetical protein